MIAEARSEIAERRGRDGRKVFGQFVSTSIVTLAVVLMSSWYNYGQGCRTSSQVALAPPVNTGGANPREHRRPAQSYLLGPHATLRQNSLRRNTMMTAPVPVAPMLSAPWSGSAHGAHGTCGAGGPRRLQAPTPPSVAAVSVGAGSSARTGVNAQFRARTRARRARSGANLWEHSTEMASCNCGYCSSQARTAATR